MDINAILIHKDHYDAIRLLNDDEAGIILKAIFEYFINGTEAEFDDRSLNILFIQLKKFCDTNRKRYEQVCKKKSENAKKRWDEYKKSKQDESMQMHTAVGKEKEKENKNENLNANSNINENVNVNKNVKATAAIPEKESAKNADDIHTHKKAHGEFKNVFLSDEEYGRLKERFADCEKRIESLSAYIRSSGKEYLDHYAQLINWQVFSHRENDGITKQKPPGERREPTFDVSEFTKKAIGIRYVPPEEMSSE